MKADKNLPSAMLTNTSENPRPVSKLIDAIQVCVGNKLLIRQALNEKESKLHNLHDVCIMSLEQVLVHHLHFKIPPFQ